MLRVCSSPHCMLLQDGHHEAWEEEYVANIVRNEVARRGINTVRALLLCFAEVAWEKFWRSCMQNKL